MHEIRRIDGRRGFRTSGNVLRIGRNTFYDQKNEIPMKILEFKRSKNKIITEFRGIPSRFSNQAAVCVTVTVVASLSVSLNPQAKVAYIFWTGGYPLSLDVSHSWTETRHRSYAPCRNILRAGQGFMATASQSLNSFI
jgi:hypothetical protein